MQNPVVIEIPSQHPDVPPLILFYLYLTAAAFAFAFAVFLLSAAAAAARSIRPPLASAVAAGSAVDRGEFFEMSAMESLIEMVNRIQRACTVLSDHGGEGAFPFPTLWEVLPSVVVVGGQVRSGLYTA